MRTARSGKYLVREGLSVEFTFNFRRRALTVTWTPGRPEKLEAAELDHYRDIREQFLRYVAVELEGTLADPAQALDVVHGQ